MKNTYKLLSLLFVFAFMTSCENNDDLGFNPQPERGWVQFLNSSPAVIADFQGSEGTLGLDVNIQVPTTSSDLTINYDLVSVSGVNPNSVFSNNGALVVPAGLTSYAGPDNNTGIEYSYLASIDFDLAELGNTALTEPMVFDVVLTGTSSGDITAGFNDEKKTIQRIQICPSIANWGGTYSVQEQFTDGPNAPFGLSDFFTESYQVEFNVISPSQVEITNSTGFDTYFIDGAIMTFGICDGVSFEDGNSEDGYPVVALFRIFEFETSSYDSNSFVVQCDGPLDTFGAYQFVLTKMQ